MDGTGYFARPVTVTEERMQEALEKQAKQRALRDALDSQMQLRGDSQPKERLSKAQLKRQEAREAMMQREAEQQRPGMLPGPVSSSPQYGGNRPVNGAAGYSGIPAPPSEVRRSPRPVNGALDHDSGAGGLSRPVPLATPIGSQMPPSRSFDDGRNGHSPSHAAEGDGHRALMAMVNRVTTADDDNFGDASGTYRAPPPARQQNRRQAPAQYDIQPDSDPSMGDDIDYGAQEAYNPPSATAVERPRARQEPRKDAVPTKRQDSRQAGAGKPPSRSQQVKEAQRVLQMEKELAKRDTDLMRLRDKERNWEKQVTDLKSELKHAKVKERELVRIARDGGRGPRAETAPQTGSIKGPSGAGGAPLKPKVRNLQPLDENDRPSAPTNGKRVGGSGVKPQKSPMKAEFNETKVIRKGAPKPDPRPITAPNALDPLEEENGPRSSLPPLRQDLKPKGSKSGSVKPAYVSVRDSKDMAPQDVSIDAFTRCVDSQLVTARQAEQLWEFLGGTWPREPTPPPTDAPLNRSQHHHHHLHQQQPPTPPQMQPERSGSELKLYETYADLDEDDDDQGYGEDDEWQN